MGELIGDDFRQVLAAPGDGEATVVVTRSVEDAEWAARQGYRVTESVAEGVTIYE